MFHRLFAALRRIPSSSTSAAPAGLAIAATTLISLTILGTAGALWLLMKLMEISDRLATAIGRRFGLF